MKQKISDRAVLRLIEKYLQQEIMSELSTWTARTVRRGEGSKSIDPSYLDLSVNSHLPLARLTTFLRPQSRWQIIGKLLLDHVFDVLDSVLGFGMRA